MSLDFANSIIFFDTSSLIDLYDYNDESIVSLLSKIAGDCAGRLFIPSYVKIEFDRHCSVKIHNPLASYDALVKKFGKEDGGFIQKIGDGLASIDSAMELLERYTQNTAKHPYILPERINALNSIISSCSAQVKTEVKLVEAEIESRKESIRNRKDYLSEWINNHVQSGRKYSYTEYLSLAKQAQSEYELEFPPGYKDLKEKTGLRRYADYIIWKQILEIAKSQKKPTVFVVNDLKEDWCYQHQTDSKRIDRPREELIYEFEEMTGEQITLLSLTQFLFEINKAFNYEVSPDLLKPTELPKAEISTVDFKADNSQSGFGILHFYQGRFDISSQNVLCRLNIAKFTNQKSIEFRLIGLRLCLAHINNDGRWAIRLRGDRLNIDLNLVPHGEASVINVDLDLDITDIPSLKNHWIVFALESSINSDSQNTIGNTYTHWRGLNV